jgi:molybdate transport system permease protein
VTDAAIIWFTVRMAALATTLLIPPALALAWLLARGTWRGKSVIETIVALPLVMPPVATGLILLKLVPHSVVFTWRAVVIAMMVMSSPFIVRAARLAFENVNPRYEQIARTLGAHEPRVFFTITLPLALRGIAGGVVLGFARALGEFGATILVAGNIPGRTTTLAVAIYDRVQLGHDSAAWRLVAAGVIVAFAAIWLSEKSTRRRT